MVSCRLPPDHAPAFSQQTSGSTGAPVRFRISRITAELYGALNLRNHLWHRHDLGAKAVALRVPRGRFGSGKEEPRRRGAWVDGFPSGSMVELDSGAPVGQQFEWLLEELPGHLLTYPSNLRALVHRSAELGVDLSFLEVVSTFGEVVTDELRSACRSAWGLPVHDIYSAQEVGVIALQCPDHEHYHVQSESVLVEVLDEHGRPCEPGEVGRVVVTDLHNFAMPLIRYEIGDYAEVGHACPCGRGLPVLKRILGRTRNMLKLPSGDLFWPSFIISKWAALGPIRQMQIVQKQVDALEVRMVVSRAMTPGEEKRLASAMRQDLGAGARLSFDYRSEIPRSPEGKYEDFVSELTS
jgi:phenylacetate-CoA ligase